MNEDEVFDPLLGQEPETEVPVIPIGDVPIIPKRDDSGAIRQKDRDARKKLNILADQVYQHAKAKGLQFFSFYEGDTPGTVASTAHYSTHLVRSLILHLADKHGDTLDATLKELNALAESLIRAEEKKPTIEVETYGEPRTEEQSGPEHDGSTIGGSGVRDTP